MSSGGITREGWREAALGARQRDARIIFPEEEKRPGGDGGCKGSGGSGLGDNTFLRWLGGVLQTGL